jgi:hypothetical protein
MGKIVEIDNITRGLLVLFVICGSTIITVTGAPIGYDDPKDICIQFGGEWDDTNGCFAKSCEGAILNPGEFAAYFVTISDGTGLKTRDWFSLEVKPRNGASILISRTITSGVMSGDVI